MRALLADDDAADAKRFRAAAVRILRELSGDELRKYATSRPAAGDLAHLIVVEAITEALEELRAATGPTRMDRPARLRRRDQRMQASVTA